MSKGSMQRWEYKQITDYRFLASLIPNVEHLFGKVDIQLHDGVIRVGVRQALINLFFWKILTAFNIPICKRHFVKRIPLNNDTLMDSLSPYYEEIISGDRKNAKKLKQVLWDMLQDLYVFTSTELLAYSCTIDILSLSRIMHEPVVEEIIKSKETITSSMGTDVIEKFIDTQSKKLMKLFGTPGALKEEILLPYQQVRQLNKFQLPQILFAFGPRTDVSDNVVGYPVMGSAIDGLSNVMEFATESLSAKKALFYNKMAVADSQYFGRKQHLLASTLQHIYDRDCGSNVLVDFKITQNNYENVIGKLIYVEGQPLYLTPDNIKNFIGEVVHMRSPMTCRYRNGVCEVCGGLIYRNINRKLNIGILSAIHVIEPTTQKILSSKHLIKTNSIIYELPKEATSALFRSSMNEIRWKPEMHQHLKKVKMGVPIKYFASVHDVKLLRSDKIVKEERFSEVAGFVLRDKDKTVNIPLENESQIPFFSTDMLLHIRDHYNQLEFEEHMVWIPLENTEKFPIFKTVVINDNMLQFVNNVSGFLSNGIAEHTSCSAALQKFSDIIHDKVSANIVHLETLLKAYLITSPGDYRIPRVTDPDSVKFETTASILNNRHIGTKLGFQNLNQYLCQPSTYLVRRSASVFDYMVGSLDA